LKWLLLSVAGFPVLASLAILTTSNFDSSSIQLRTTQLLPQIVVILLIALGEEYGWRGYLLPRLMKRFNVFYSAIILGVIWGLWHFPAYLIGTGTPEEMSFTLFLLWVVLGTLFISWIYYYTRSVLTSILAHISANAAFNYLNILPEFTGSTNTFWWFIIYTSLLIVIVYYINRNDLMTNSTQQS
jgi:membrane protease YdiL (CAAX protease family)